MTPSGSPGLLGWNSPELQRNDVYVFGSTESGYHSQADAGFAFKGTTVADWHCNSLFRERFAAADGKGLRAVWGCSHGLQEGTAGLGFAIPVAIDWGVGGDGIDGIDRYRARKKLAAGVDEVVAFARAHPDLRMVVGPVGLLPSEGGAGIFTTPERDRIWSSARRRSAPPNISFQSLEAPRTSSPEPEPRVVSFTTDRPVGAGISIVDLPKGTDPQTLEEPHLYVGNLPSCVSPLSDPDWVWEGTSQSAVAHYSGGVLDAAAERRFRRGFLHLLSTERGAAAAAALDDLVERVKAGPIILTTVGQPGSVHPVVLANLVQNRLDIESAEQSVTTT